MACTDKTLEEVKIEQCEATQALKDKITGDENTDIEYDGNTYPSIDKKTKQVVENYMNITTPELIDIKNEIIENKETTIINREATDEALAETIEAKNEAGAIKSDCEAIRDDIEGYVIPDEATYSPEEIDLRANTMTEAEYQAIAKSNREIFRSSGFVEWGNTYSPTSGYRINKGLWCHSIRLDSTRKVLHIGRRLSDSIEKTGSPYPVLNINGNLINLKFYDDIGPMVGTDYDYGTILTPPPATSLATITDSSNLPVDMKQGDFAILKDINKELIVNGDFTSDDLSSYYINENYFTKEITDDGLKITLNTDDGVNRWGGIRFDSVFLLKGVKYKFKFKITDRSDTNKYFYMRGILNHNSIYFRDIGDYEIELIGNNEKLSLDLEFASGNYFIINNISVKQMGDQPIIALKDVSAGIDIYENPTLFEGRKSISRKDLVFLETWQERIADKGVRYPFGNIQYRGADTDGLSGIADGTFEGKETYSLFGNWQNDNDLVGKAYKEEDLTVEDKIKFNSNPDNNVFLKDGEEWQQRYRIRVIKGLGDEWLYIYSNRFDLNSGALAYSSLYDRIQAKLDLTNIGGDLGGYKEYSIKGEFRNLSSYENSDYGHFTNNDSSTIHNAFALPIALVQKRNDGIWHPIYNDEGTALAYKDGVAMSIADIYSDTTYITSLEDCFNPDKIAVVNKSDSSDFTSLTDYNNGSVSQDDYAITGYIISGMSGRPDGLYADEVNECDVEDLRLDANKRPLKEEHDRYRRLAEIGQLRGKEEYSKLKTIDVTLTSLSTIASWRGDANYLLYDRIYNFDYIDYEISGYIVDDNNEIFEIIFIIDSYCRVNKIVNGDIKLGSFTVGKTYKFYLKDKCFKSDSTTYTYNNTLTHCDIIGDPRTLDQRTSIYTVTGDDQTATISKNMYVKANDNYYRSLVDRGDITIDPDTEDYSNTDNWVDLGTDGSIGGYRQDWLDKGIIGSPLLVDEDGNSCLPIDRYDYKTYSGCYIDNPYLTFKASKKIIGFRLFLVMKKDGTWEKWYNASSSGSCPNWDHEDASINPCGGNVSINNNHNIVINDSYAQHLGYSSKQEMLDLMKVIVFYKTYAIGLRPEYNRPVYSVDDVANIEGDTLNNNNPISFLTQNLINKVNTDVIDSYYGIKFKQLGLNKNNVIDFNYGAPTLQKNVNDLLYFKNVKCPKVIYFTYITSIDNRAYLYFIFKELKFDDETYTWGDDNVIWFYNWLASLFDTNGKLNIKGTKAIPLPFIIEEEID